MSKLETVSNILAEAERIVRGEMQEVKESIVKDIQDSDLSKDINDGLRIFAYLYLSALVMEEMEQPEAKQMFAQVNMVKGHILAEVSK